MNNSTLIATALKQMADSLATRFAFPESIAVCLQSAAISCDWNWLIDQEMANMLQQRGAVVFLPRPTAAEKSCYRLEYLPLTLQIRYQSSSVFKKMLQRSLDVAFSVRILDDENRLLLSQTFTGHWQDLIPRKQLSLVENSALPFTKGTLETRSFFDRVIEPLLITGVIGGIIYLFYSFRTPS